MTESRNSLEPIEPSTARELFLEHKENEVADATVKNYADHLKFFVQWCEQEDIDNLNTLTGRNLQEFRLWKQNMADLCRMTVNNYMSTMRVFLKWSASIEAVPSDLYDKVMIPRVPPEERQRDETLEAEQAQEILAYLDQYKYASREHVALALLWETGMRMGGALSLDLENVLLERQTLQLKHRPETDTPLKNGGRGERLVAISPDLTTVLEDYIRDRRIDIEDEYGRDPLFTTSCGRMQTATFRRLVIKLTAPCFRGKECPDCSAVAQEKCGEAVTPHSIRRGSITHFLSNDVPAEVISDRMNVTKKILDLHYDKRSEEVKVEQRRDYLDSL